MAATHTGECQICGRRQKPPKGALSNHGYTVKRFGFFHGTCRGAHYLPFEQSCNRIKEVLEDMEEEIKMIEEKIKELSVPTTEPKGWMRTVKGAWVLADIHEVEKHGYTFVTFSYENNGRVETGNFRGSSCSTALEQATELNLEKAECLKQKINEMRQYIKWQQERVANWKPRDLNPI